MGICVECYKNPRKRTLTESQAKAKSKSDNWTDLLSVEDSGW